MTEAWKAGDAMLINCQGRILLGSLKLAFGNAQSLMLGFEGMITGHAGSMPVLQGDDGCYRSIMDNTEVTLWRPAPEMTSAPSQA